MKKPKKTYKDIYLKDLRLLNRISMYYGDEYKHDEYNFRTNEYETIVTVKISMRGLWLIYLVEHNINPFKRFSLVSAKKSWTAYTTKKQIKKLIGFGLLEVVC